MKIFKIHYCMILYKIIMKILPKDSIEYNYFNQCGCNCVTHYHIKGGKDFLSK